MEALGGQTAEGGMSPIYDFSCECGREESERRKMKDAAYPKVCQTCGSNMERVYAPVAARVKGGTPTHHDRAWVRGAGGQGNSVRRSR